MLKQFDRKAARAKRHRRVRTRVSGTANRPRLNVFRSLHHLYAQLIDDTSGRTLASASTLSLKLSGKGVDEARQVGQALARGARELGISSAVFDRGGFLYHGRVQALADGAREAGLEF